ncbi:MAG: 2-C-methyl-D-erythritol 4-phosphate cytidylyltransferase [Syntrophaceae bacterium]|nr:2-C-methyl-D-erythritol 4-phosphate cytidylyltransferase [Syntrophaceae bacterium]
MKCEEARPVAPGKSTTGGKLPPKKTIAIIPAGGAGRRMGTGQAKQYLRLQGRPILAHTLQVLQESRSIDEIILVVPEADISRVRRDIVKAFDFKKISMVLPGGRERQDSVLSGLDAVGEDCRVVVVHDGVRPFPPASLIRRVVAEARRGRAVVVGTPARDTVKRADPDGRVLDTLERKEIWLIQTPQAFPAAMLKEAYRKACADNYYGTDDASLVERAGYPVVIIPGDSRNIKITTREDLATAEHLSANRRSRVGRS